MDLAALQERLGHPEESIRVYEDLVKRDPKADLAANNLAMLLATYRKDAKSLARAKELTTRFANSSVPAFVNTAGWVEYKLGNYPAAIPLLQSASDKDPESPQLRYMLGIAQYRAGRRADALKNLEGAVGAGKTFAGIDDARAALADLKRS
jgi:tetratricopeptide (TPR) repeat protein